MEKPISVRTPRQGVSDIGVVLHSAAVELDAAEKNSSVPQLGGEPEWGAGKVQEPNTGVFTGNGS